MDALDAMLPPHWHRKEDGSGYFNDLTHEESDHNPALKFLEMRRKYLGSDNAEVKDVLDDYIADQKLRLEFTNQPEPSPVKSPKKGDAKGDAIDEELSMGSGDFLSMDEINKLGATGSSKKIECKGKHYDYKTQWNERDLFGKVTLYGLMIRYFEDHNTLIKFDGIDGEWIFTSLKGPYGRLTQHDLYIGAQVTVFGRHLTILSCNAAAVQWAEREHKRLEKQQELFRSKILSVGQRPCVLKPEAQTIKHITRDQKAVVHVNLRKMLNENARLGEQLSSLGLSVVL